MSIRFPKKVRKRRGWRTHGYGRISQHRKSGQRGGKGYSGYKKHLKSWIVQNEPDYFGKHGFKRPINAVTEVKAINLREVNRLLEKLAKTEKTVSSKVYQLDLNEFGYQKLLSTGFLTIPVEIKVQKATQSAIEKVQSAGGKVITPVQ